MNINVALRARTPKLHFTRLCLSTARPCTTLPEPTLHVGRRSGASVSLVCRTAGGRRGREFALYEYREKVDSRELPSDASEVHFNVSVNEGDSGSDRLFCCLYKTKRGCFSAFSPYLKLEQRDVAPPPPTPALPPPLLSVEPPSGAVSRGAVLSFSCSVPALGGQSGSRPGPEGDPPTFLLLRTPERAGAPAVALRPQASRAAGAEARPGVFAVGPVTAGEQGAYSCMYQISKDRGAVNSSVSNTVRVTVSDAPPAPTLELQLQTDVWRLLCTGSPSYPGAVFSVYAADGELPVDTRRASATEHRARFPVPVQNATAARYQCQYSVQLGSYWSHSERSAPLVLTKEISPTPTPAEPAVDLPLVLGSFSAAVLFLCSVALAVVIARTQVKAAAEKKKKRQEAQFWSQVHARDHVVELTLRRSSFSSQEWVGGGTETTPTTPPLWNPLTTFTAPLHPR
ncbi:uncharacterized protein LOC114843237 [Betta splendens]|uniref:Uncharacterized protein LOC114843237 n=1 Tax=Betta splendens TaxID=158456 RepID=A0A6P7KSP9_BETSP|nr:uncharacterized protein LOC114843237 [Betta splendens]